MFKLDVDIFHQKQPNCKLDHMKEQQKRKIQQFHPEIEDGIDLRRCPHRSHRVIEDKVEGGGRH